MAIELLEEKMVKIESFNGIDIYQVKTDRFKTNTINIFFHDSLNKECVTKNALIPAVLRRGCTSYPTLQNIALYLEELYGSGFDCGVAKKGERQIIQFYIDYVNDRYTDSSESLFEKTFELLYELITSPVTENGGFKKEYVEQEKENLKKLIESRVNDKVQYGIDKCFEEMCKDEPYGIYEYGSVQDLNLIDEKKLFDYYQTFLAELPISVFITGNLEENKLKWMVEKLKQLKRANVKTLEISSVEKNVENIRNVTENMNVNQGKLSLGFRTKISANDPKYYTLLVYNGILGGGMHSKLFQNVREKASLAYYAMSRLEKFKGLMVVSSGIELQNKDKAIKIIMEQLQDIIEGKISDYEYDSTIKSIETGIKSIKDSQLQVVDFYLSQAIAGTNDTLEDIIEKVKRVTKKDVSEVAKKIQHDTVYFLTGGEK